MHIFSSAIKNTRNTALVRWLSDGVLLFDNHEINVDDYRTFLHSQIDGLERFFSTDVLCGHTLEQLGISADFISLNDTGNAHQLGYNPFLGDIRGNTDSRKFLEALVKDGSLVSLKNGQLVWSTVDTEHWLSAINQANNQAQALAHVTQGSPGRMTEEAKFQAANTPVSRKHLVVPYGMNTLAFFANYWKGALVSGRFKEVLRLLPYRIARLLFILIRIVRPIEWLYLAKYRVMDQERDSLTAVYRTYIWTSIGSRMDSRQMYRNLDRFLAAAKDRNGKPLFYKGFATRSFRHFIAAVQRKHIEGSAKYTEKIAEQKTSMGDYQAGRSEGTSQQYYAVEHGPIKLEPGFITHYIEYSKRCHNFWMLKTEHEDGDKYGV